MYAIALILKLHDELFRHWRFELILSCAETYLVMNSRGVIGSHFAIPNSVGFMDTQANHKTNPKLDPRIWTQTGQHTRQEDIGDN